MDSTVLEVGKILSIVLMIPIPLHLIQVVSLTFVVLQVDWCSNIGLDPSAGQL